MAAELPSVRPDVLIVESTYGVHIHEKREDREKRFTSTIHDIVTRYVDTIDKYREAINFGNRTGISLLTKFKISLYHYLLIFLISVIHCCISL